MSDTSAKTRPDELTPQRSTSSELLFEAVFASAPVGILVADQEGLVRQINQTYLDIVGGDAKADDFIGKVNIRDFYVYHRAGIQGYFEQIYEGKTVQFETPIVTVNRRQAFLEYRAAPVHDVHGRVQGAVVMVHDSTPRKRVELEQRKLTAKFEALFNHMPAGILFVDRRSGFLLHANRMAMDMFGQHLPANCDYSEYERTYRVEQQDGSPYPEKRLPIRRALATGEAQHVDDLFIHRHDGSRIRLEVWAVPLSWSSGASFDAVAALMQDVTERKAMEQAKEAQQAKSKQEMEQLFKDEKMRSIARLAGGVAHDFNNILVSVLGNASIIQAEMSPDNQWYSPINSIVNSAERAALITRQLLVYSRGGTFAPKPNSLHTVVEESLPLCRSAISKKYALHCESKTDQDICEIDATQIQQIMLNLCMNAAEAMEGGGQIRITITSAPGPADSPLAGRDCVCLQIEDSGCGVSEDIKDKIYEPFFTTKELGRGLGLASVYGMLQDHGAEIRLQSTQGAGTRFTLFFAHCNKS